MYEFLRPYKQLLPDIVTSKESMARAIDLASFVYSSLEKRGHRVTFAPADSKMFRVAIDEREAPGKDRKYGRWSHGKIWSPQRPTVTYVDDFVIGIALTEVTERVTLRRG